MAKTLSALRDSLESQVFNETVSTDVTITPVSRGSSSDGGFTPASESDGSPVTVKGVPYSNATEQSFKEMFGNSNAAEGTVIVPHDASVSVGDKIAWLGTTYRVEQVEDFIYGGGVAAKQVLCNEKNA